MSGAAFPHRDTGFAVWLNGGYGVGKSAVLDHVGDLLAAHQLPFSLLDVDWFHRSWPEAPDDPENVIIGTANMAAVWANYQKAGPRQLVISGVLLPTDRLRYERALALPIRSIRLEAGPDITSRRLEGRYSAGRALALEWHLGRFHAVAELLGKADLDELVVSTDDRAPLSTATEILQHFGLVDPPISRSGPGSPTAPTQRRSPHLDG